jgi:hypothetical protein
MSSRGLTGGSVAVGDALAETVGERVVPVVGRRDGLSSAAAHADAISIKATAAAVTPGACVRCIRHDLERRDGCHLSCAGGTRSR